MDLTYYIAQVMGLYFFLVGLAMLIHPTRFKAIMKEFQECHALIVYTGVVGLIFGLILVVAHNYWPPAWPVVITIVSWLILVKSIFRLFFLDQFIAFTEKMYSKAGYNWMCWISLIVGAYLAVMGFFS